MSESSAPPSSPTKTRDALDSDATIGAGTRDDVPSRPYEAGYELGGRYRLVGPLGKGGMGEVWEAEHTALGRMVAIKLVRADEPDVRYADRLQREAELVARLEHPNIVNVTDLGFAPDGRPFVVMERLRGRTLSQLLRERGALSWTQARDIGVQICSGLAHAHGLGIVHRDLKPSNVFVLEDSHGHLTIKIIDFGLAKATVLGPRDRVLTRSEIVFGTPGYMAPEQVRGEPLDGRVDLYATGAILYEMMIGEPLWIREAIPQVLYCQLFEQPPSLRARVDVPVELDALVARCLCKDRELRHADADALRLGLVGVGSGKGATMVPRETIPMPAPELQARYATMPPLAPAMPERSPTPAPRGWIAPLAVVVVVAIGLVAALAWQRRASSPVDAADETSPPPELAEVPATTAPPTTPPRAVEPPALPAVAVPPTTTTTVTVTPAPPKSAAPPRGPAPTKRSPKRPIAPASEPGTEPAAPPAGEPTPKPPKRDGEVFQPFE